MDAIDFEVKIGGYLDDGFHYVPCDLSHEGPWRAVSRIGSGVIGISSMPSFSQFYMNFHHYGTFSGPFLDVLAREICREDFSFLYGPIEEETTRLLEVPVDIHPVFAYDLFEVSDIANACSLHLSPDDLYSRHEDRCEGIVARYNNQVLGALFYQIRNGDRKERVIVDDFFVHPGVHRKRVGQKMIRCLQDKVHLPAWSESGILLNVRERNLSVQLFLQSQGFLWVDTMHNDYHDTGEDAYIMEYVIDH